MVDRLLSQNFLTKVPHSNLISLSQPLESGRDFFTVGDAVRQEQDSLLSMSRRSDQSSIPEGR
jgi:hypothetical protein